MNHDFTQLLVGAPPWLVTVAIGFYAAAQIATLCLQVFQFLLSRFNAREIGDTKAKVRETKHTLNDVSQKIDAVATIVKNGNH